METEATKYVAINPQGQICNPTADTEAELIHVLETGHWRSGGSGKWEDIKKDGYIIRKASVKLLPRNNQIRPDHDCNDHEIDAAGVGVICGICKTRIRH